MTQQTGQQGHAICNYEGASYRARFWSGQGREYEDLAERIALRRLLPPRGRRLIEVGAGFGRLADLYQGYEQVILLDYAKSGLREAQDRLGHSSHFLYVAADLYRLPLAPATCDTVVTVRVLHHVADVPAALSGLAALLRPGGQYVLEFANKRNLKAIARYLFGRQRWSPFTRAPYEFASLNFDFHPGWMTQELTRVGLHVDAALAVSHFRHPLLKRLIPAPTLARLDGALQRVGATWKLTPSIFLRTTAGGSGAIQITPLFRCPTCLSQALQETADTLACSRCGAVWGISDGIYDFKEPLQPGAAPIGESGNSDHVAT